MGQILWKIPILPQFENRLLKIKKTFFSNWILPNISLIYFVQEEIYFTIFQFCAKTSYFLL